MIPTISVIIPIYNLEKSIANTVRCVQNQTISNIEIILVNDGSTDKSGDICENLARSDNRIKVIHQVNSGVSAARNKGIDVATGHFIGFVDGDDEIDPDLYELLYSDLKAHNADGSMCGILIKRVDGSVYSEYGTENIYVFEKQEAIHAFLMGNVINVSMNTKLFKSEIIKRCKFKENLRINEDKEMIFQCLLLSEKVVCNDICKYIYMKRENSATEESFSMKFLDMVKVAGFIKDYICKHYPDYETIAKRNYLLSKLYIYRMLTRGKQYMAFRSEYLDLRNQIRGEDYSDYYRLLPKSKQVEIFVVKHLSSIYGGLLKLYDLTIK